MFQRFMPVVAVWFAIYACDETNDEIYIYPIEVVQDEDVVDVENYSLQMVPKLNDNVTRFPCPGQNQTHIAAQVRMGSAGLPGNHCDGLGKSNCDLWLKISFSWDQEEWTTLIAEHDSETNSQDTKQFDAYVNGTKGRSYYLGFLAIDDDTEGYEWAPNFHTALFDGGDTMINSN